MLKKFKGDCAYGNVAHRRKYYERKQKPVDVNLFHFSFIFPQGQNFLYFSFLGLADNYILRGGIKIKLGFVDIFIFISPPIFKNSIRHYWKKTNANRFNLSKTIKIMKFNLSTLHNPLFSTIYEIGIGN